MKKRLLAPSAIVTVIVVIGCTNHSLPDNAAHSYEETLQYCQSVDEAHREKLKDLRSITSEEELDEQFIEHRKHSEHTSASEDERSFEGCMRKYWLDRASRR